MPVNVIIQTFAARSDVQVPRVSEEMIGNKRVGPNFLSGKVTRKAG